MFQRGGWRGGWCFSDGEGFIFKWGGASILVGGGFLKKIIRWGNPAVCLPFIIQRVAQIKFNVILTPL